MTNSYSISARIFLIFFALYALLGMHFFMHNQGGSGLYLPFNMVGWAFISVLISIRITSYNVCYTKLLRYHH